MAPKNYRCTYCLQAGKVVDKEKAHIKAHLGTIHRLGPFFCSEPTCNYVNCRRDYTLIHIQKQQWLEGAGGLHHGATVGEGGHATLNAAVAACHMPHAAAVVPVGPASGPVVAPPVTNLAAADDEDESRTYLARLIDMIIEVCLPYLQRIVALPVQKSFLGMGGVEIHTASYLKQLSKQTRFESELSKLRGINLDLEEGRAEDSTSLDEINISIDKIAKVLLWYKDQVVDDSTASTEEVNADLNRLDLIWTEIKGLGEIDDADDADEADVDEDRDEAMEDL